MNESNRVGDLTRDELKEVIDEHTVAAMKAAVHETLLQLGVDTSSPLEMQRDFQHLRDWRTAQEAIQRKGYITIIGVLVTGSFALLWIGAKDFILNLVK